MLLDFTYSFNVDRQDAYADWPYSTIHRYLREGLYAPDWASIPDCEVPGDD